MDYYWSAKFPPLGEPGRLLLWLIQAHTGHLFAYPVGGANGASLFTVVCVVAGSVALWKRGRLTLVAACLAPLGLALAASAIRAYPYGESERLTQFEGPMICLLTGFGLAWLVGRLRRPGSYRRVGIGCLTLFGSIGVGSIVADFIQPGKSPEDLGPETSPAGSGSRSDATPRWPAPGSTSASTSRGRPITDDRPTT